MSKNLIRASSNPSLISKINENGVVKNETKSPPDLLALNGPLNLLCTPMRSRKSPPTTSFSGNIQTKDDSQEPTTTPPTTSQSKTKESLLLESSSPQNESKKLCLRSDAIRRKLQDDSIDSSSSCDMEEKDIKERLNQRKTSQDKNPGGDTSLPKTCSSYEIESIHSLSHLGRSIVPLGAAFHMSQSYHEHMAPRPVAKLRSNHSEDDFGFSDDDAGNDSSTDEIGNSKDGKKNKRKVFKAVKDKVRE